MIRSHSRRSPVLFLLSLISLASVAYLQGYATLGHKWATTSVPYYINPQSIWVGSAAATSAIQTGANAWRQQTRANISLTYAGTTSGSSLKLNSKNEMFFRNDSNGGVIAETYTWWDAGGNLVDADMVFHEGGFKFYAFSGCTDGVYVEDVAIHEFGHVLGLQHSGVANATMEPTMPELCDTSQLSLEPDDISGIESLYPPTGGGGGGGGGSTNTAPTVSITGPASNSSYTQGTAITFSGSASDVQDGNITSRLTWTSNLSGQIGSGGQVSAALGAGTHTITASVTDNAGLTGSQQITVTVNGVAAPAGESPDGSIIPNTTSAIKDSAGNVWTLQGSGSSKSVLLNGGGTGAAGVQILYVSRVIYVFTGAWYYRWNGSGFVSYGSGAPIASAPPPSSTTSPTAPGESADGSVVPNTTNAIQDSGGNIWTLQGNGTVKSVMLNGGGTGAAGVQILYVSRVIYVYTGGWYYYWSGSQFASYGAIAPIATAPPPSSTTSSPTAPGESPDSSIVPTTTSAIQDSAGNVWTMAGSGTIKSVLLNGAGTGAAGVQILYKNRVVYVYTGGWTYRWDGSQFVSFGAGLP